MAEYADREGALQAKALRSPARANELLFEAYLPPNVADWLMGLIEAGTFADPSEAAFVILREHHELEPHRDLREEILRRRLHAALDDPSPMIPHKEVLAELVRWIARLATPPAVWQKHRK
jgi:hypothetical protein